MHAGLLQQFHVRRVFHVPWSVLLFRCFLKCYTILPPLLSHPLKGLTDANIIKWLKLAEQVGGVGLHVWQLATTYLKEEGFILFAGARLVDSHEQWIADVENVWKDWRNHGVQWWTELRMWCYSTQFRAVQDMAFHNKQFWLNAWVIWNRPSAYSHPLACYERWLQYREDIDIGYVFVNPDNL